MAKAQVEWTGEKCLTWKDFKGLPEKGSKYKAESVTYITCDYYILDKLIEINVKNLLDENLSWYSDTSELLLVHERMHFNITEIYARKIRKFLNEADFIESDENKVRTNIAEILKNRNQYQILYDYETNHSENQEQQLRWNKLIADELNQLNKYCQSTYLKDRK